jgi:hypothetical protein
MLEQVRRIIYHPDPLLSERNDPYELVVWKPFSLERAAEIRSYQDQ